MRIIFLKMGPKRRIKQLKNNLLLRYLLLLKYMIKIVAFALSSLKTMRSMYATIRVIKQRIAFAGT